MKKLVQSIFVFSHLSEKVKLPKTLVLFMLILSFFSLANAQYTSGNLVLLMTGDGATTLSNAGMAVQLQEITTAGTLVGSAITVNNTGTTSGTRLVQSGTATSEGYMSLSGDGRYLSFAGYDATVGTTGIAATANPTTTRMAGVINNAKTITLSGTTTAYSANNMRSAVTENGTNIWMAGSNTGVETVTNGTVSASSSASNTLTNIRCLGIFGGQLYFTTASGTSQGLYKVGNGVSTTTGQTASLMVGNTASVGFALLDADASIAGVDLLYILTDGAGTNQLTKYYYDGTSWTSKGSATVLNAKNIAVVSTACGTRELYITHYPTATTSALIKFTETSTASGTAVFSGATTLLAKSHTTPNDRVIIRGVAFAPEASAKATIAGTSTINLGSSTNLTFTLAGSPTYPVTITYSDGTNLYTTSATSSTKTVSVSPTVNTTYSLVSIIDANCIGSSTTYGAATVTVNTSFPHTIAFVRNDTTVSEGVGTAKIWVKVTSVGNQTGTVDLTTSAYSNATSGGTDYTAPSTFTIPSNATLNQLFSFDIPVNDDASAEADEYIIAKLTGATNLTINTSAQTTLYIRDNDKLTPAPSNQLSLSLLGSFSNGTAFSLPPTVVQINSAEISAFDSASKRVFIANSIGSKLDIVNFANPSAPSLVSSIDITPYGAINSVAARNGIIALAIENSTNKQLAGKVVFVDANGALIDSVTVGAMPDMIVFNHAGTKVYTANEGEPNDAYTSDPEGSISAVDITTLLTTGITTATNVRNIGFTGYNGLEATLRSQGIRIYGTGASAAQDFEPEYITISEDDTKAWVTLQENNAVAELNLISNTITQLIPLGYKNHNLTANALDASDQTFGVNLSNFPVKGMYQPDAIASYNVSGTTYFITANEGDSRAYTGMNEETRVGSMNLDATVFPNAAELKDNRVLGRLRATNKLGDTDNDGDFDEIYCFGARSFSVWNTSTSSLIYDSGDELERITANDATYNAFFNFNSGGAKKDRSDDKGPEQEGVTVGKVNGIPYAFVGMERTGGVLVYNIANPASPAYVTYKNNRPADVSPEGVVFVPAAQSPNGKNLLILSNEISSTLTVYQVNPCTAPGIAAISAAGSTAICAGSSVQLDITTPNGAYSYQWLKNNAAISTANAASYTANAVGDYKLAVVNTTTGCVDTSSVITVTIPADVTNPSITAPATVSVCVNSGCSAYGINLGTPVTADNCTVASVTNNAPASFPLGNTTVTWTVTDAAGNTATANQTVTVTDGTNPTVYLAQDNLVAGATGPNSSKTPYLRPSVNGVKFTSILSVDDAIGGYAMAGIPDGLGAFDNCDGTFTLLMNHEIANTLGVTRAHGSIGSFVSKWIINKNTLSVVSGSDLMQNVYLWNTTTNSYDLAGANGAALTRFCSADLPAPSAFYNSVTGKGTTERIFMNGEESGVEGRAFGHIATGANAGKTYQLPWLGKFAWENAVASPASLDTTLVGGLDDGTGGQVYFYIGAKTNTGTEIEKAGLSNGKQYGVKVTGFATERVNATTINNPPAANTPFSLVDLGTVTNMTGATLNTNSVAAGITSFSRPEDGAWDPSNPNDFYFATTDQYDQVSDGVGTQVGRSRVWRLRFANVTTPTLGGTITAVLDGTEGINMIDNLSVDKFGHLILQEDVGNQQHNGKVWQYTIATDALTQIAMHDPARFGNVGVAVTAPYSQDEESSGVVDVSDILGAGMHLLVNQAHYTTGISTQAVEGGQLLAMFVPASMGVTSTAADTVIVCANNVAGNSATGVSLGTPATADNCSVSSIVNNAPTSFSTGYTNVTWTVTDGSGNTNTATQVVKVNAAPAAPTAPATVCAFDAATITATPSTGTIKWHDNNAHTGAALNFFGNSHVATTTGNYYAFALGSNGCYSQPATTVATVRTTLPTATPTAAGTYYATDVVNDGTYNHYCRCADNTILLSVASTYTPANNFDADGTPAADAYSVKVEVGDSLITNLGNAPYNNILGASGWQVISRTWDLELGVNAQEPSSAVNVISYFTDAEYSAVNAILATPLTSPSQMTMYKLKNNPYPSAMIALDSAHALIDSSKIYLFNNQNPYTPHWTLGTVAAGLYSATYAVNEFSGGGGGGGNGGSVPFPITLTNFSGYNENAVNRLQWTTEAELNADKFVVERSIENQTFEVIGEVSATGNSTSTRNYAFNDRTFASNTNYYRLKMLDKDGTFSYSKTIEIATNKLNVMIYPNPAQNEVFISGSFPANAKVSISNMLGQEVLKANLDTNSQTAVSLQNISKGIYMLNILNKENAVLHSEKLVKE